MAEITKEELEILERMRGKYEDVHPYRLRDGSFVVVRKATPIERTRILTELSGKNKDSGIAGPHRTMARSVIVYPEAQEERDSLLAKYPFFCDKATNRAVELAEGDAEDLGNV